MAIKPENNIDLLTKEKLESGGVYTTIPEELDLYLLESRPDVLILRVRVGKEQFDRYMKVSKAKFVAWMRHKLKLLEPESG